MTTRGRITAVITTVALTLAIAVFAIVAGGPLRGLAAPNTAATGRDTATIDGGPGFAALGMNFPDRSSGNAPGYGGDMQAGCQTLVTNMAANLNVTTDQFQAAFKKTLIQQIDAAQAAGTMTATQAQAARDRINSATGSLCDNLSQLAGPGTGGMGVGPAALQGEVLNAAAGYFAISTDQFKQDIQSTSSLQGVAAKYGKDNAAGKAGLETALEAALKQSLQTRGLAASAIDQAVNAFKQGFDRIYTAPIGTFGQGGGPMNRPGGPGNMPGPRFPHPGATPSATPVH